MNDKRGGELMDDQGQGAGVRTSIVAKMIGTDQLGRTVALFDKQGDVARPEEQSLDRDLLQAVRAEIGKKGLPSPPARHGWSVERAVRISDLEIADARDEVDAVQIRAALDPQTVERYALSFIALPAVEIFKVTQAAVRGVDMEAARYVLADGFHRVAAALRLGLESIPAYVRAGTWQEAQEHAVAANLQHGLAFSRDDRNAAIVRLRRLGWDLADIGKLVRLTEAAVHFVVRVAEVRDAIRLQTLNRLSSWRAVEQLSDRKVREVAKAEPADWLPLTKVASQHDWSSDAIRTAVTTLVKQPACREALFAGQTQADGTAIKPAPQRPERADAEFFKLRHALSGVLPFAGVEPSVFVRKVGEENLREFVEELDRYIKFLRSVHNAAKAEAERGGPTRGLSEASRRRSPPRRKTG